ncbi:spore germination protein [Paenibacillus lutrae]|uniref:Spore germination protein n=1 Tax=Paenibacillus lutrae TaxID=2078573 RepID=A0A7X3FG47_9BACL|nr:spore germination protein [Paenibacillus lutrae]
MKKTGTGDSSQTSTSGRGIIPSEYLQESGHPREISGILGDDIWLIQELMKNNEDLVVRHFHLFDSTPASLVFLTSLSDQEVIRSYLLKPLMTHLKDGGPAPEIQTGEQLSDYIVNQVIQVSHIKTASEIKQLVDNLTRGQTILLVEGIPHYFLTDTRHIQKRAIEQPQTEQVIRGPREGFIEQLETNLSLLRYRLQTPDFRVEAMQIGRLTKSEVALCYIQGITNPVLIDEAKKRLSSIDTDAILDAGFLEQFIEDHPLSPFPQIQNTERPDKTVAALLEGRVIIMVDGSPFALIAPTVFTQFYQTVDDYTERFLIASMIRIIRLIALVFSLLFPALYVSVISFNPELIPTDFAVAVAGARAGVPFPAMLEVLIMEISMEILREATIRLPQLIGGALSIVGVLVIGQAAVSAGFSSPITVVIIALTTVGSFATPAYNAAIALRMLRFPLIILAGCFGLYGVMLGVILIVNHMLSIRSFGIPYLAPLVPFNAQGWKDALVRGPLWGMKKRPDHLQTMNRNRRNQTDKYFRSYSSAWDSTPEATEEQEGAKS